MLRIARGRNLPNGYDRSTDQPRMRRLFAAAVSARGDVREMLARLRIERRVLLQHLSILRRLGVARTVSLFDPRRCGRPCEVLVLVRMASYAPADLHRFEAMLIADDAVTAAVKIAGKCDYQLSACHPDLMSASAWVRAVGEREEVATAKMAVVNTLFGHTLPGLPLQHGGDLSGEA